MGGVTYITSYGARTEDISGRQTLACATEMGHLLVWSPVELFQVCFGDGVGFSISCGIVSMSCDDIVIRGGHDKER